jgi:transcriptional regulator with XRE-family HTH domain
MFADRLQELRDAAGLSQYALAKRSGITKQAVSRLEKGERDPNWETVQRLALALGVDCRAFTDPDLQLPEQAPPGKPGRPRKQPPVEEPTTKKPRARGKGKQ